MSESVDQLTILARAALSYPLIVGLPSASTSWWKRAYAGSSGKMVPMGLTSN
jgi:hypothetical protein